MTATVWGWLVQEGGIYRAAIGWVVGGVLGVGLTWLKLRPSVRRGAAMLRDHVHQQHVIVNLLDTDTPGGLHDVVETNREIAHKLSHGRPSAPRAPSHGLPARTELTRAGVPRQGDHK